MSLRDVLRSDGRIAPKVDTTRVIATSARDMICSTISVYPFMEQLSSAPLVPSAAEAIVCIVNFKIIDNNFFDFRI